MAILCWILCFGVVGRCVFGGSGSGLCDDAQISAACMSLYFGSSLKCLWNVVPDQHTGTTGLTSKLSSSLILLYCLLDYTFLLFVHFEFLHPDVWWVKMNIILCFNHFLYFKLLTSVLGGLLLFCQWITGGHIGAVFARFYDPNTLLLLRLFLSYHSVWGHPSFRLSHDQQDLAFQNQMQINLWGKKAYR